MFNGAISALITPFRDGAVDERRCVSWSNGKSSRALTVWRRAARPASRRRSLTSNTRW